MTENRNGISVRTEIEKEVASWGRKPRLNNFFKILPYPGSRNGCLRADLGDDLGKLDLPWQFQPRFGMSDRMSKQTPREFFREVEDVVKKTPGVDYEEVLRLQLELDNAGKQIRGWSPGMAKKDERRELRASKKWGIAQQILYRYVIRVYIELRVRGYSHLDLTA